MDNYIVINGAKIPLADEQINMINATIKPKRQNPFDRVENDQMYYSIEYDGSVSINIENDNPYGDKAFETGNYCTDFNLMGLRALHETLGRLLWRFSMENGERENQWDGKHGHYYIYNSDPVFSSFEVGLRFHSKINGVSYFPSMELAKQAITEIIEPFMKKHPEFVW